MGKFRNTIKGRRINTKKKMIKHNSKFVGGNIFELIFAMSEYIPAALAVLSLGYGLSWVMKFEENRMREIMAQRINTGAFSGRSYDHQHNFENHQGGAVMKQEGGGGGMSISYSPVINDSLIAEYKNFLSDGNNMVFCLKIKDKKLYDEAKKTLTDSQMEFPSSLLIVDKG